MEEKANNWLEFAQTALTALEFSSITATAKVIKIASAEMKLVRSFEANRIAGEKGISFPSTKGYAKFITADQEITTLNRKYTLIEKAQSQAVDVKKLPDGRIRYYGSEKPSSAPGQMRGLDLLQSIIQMMVMLGIGLKLEITREL